jgi:hypothetical protein
LSGAGAVVWSQGAQDEHGLTIVALQAAAWVSHLKVARAFKCKLNDASGMVARLGGTSPRRLLDWRRRTRCAVPGTRSPAHVACSRQASPTAVPSVMLSVAPRQLPVLRTAARARGPSHVAQDGGAPRTPGPGQLSPQGSRACRAFCRYSRLPAPATCRNWGNARGCRRQLPSVRSALRSSSMVVRLARAGCPTNPRGAAAYPSSSCGGVAITTRVP